MISRKLLRGMMFRTATPGKEAAAVIEPMRPRGLEDKLFLWLVIAVSLAFAWIVAPVFGAVLWAIVCAILFAPLHRRILAVLKRPNLAACASLGLIIAMVILPLTIFAVAVTTEASSVYERIEKGEVNFGKYLQQVIDSLPPWAANLMDRFGLSNMTALKQKLSAGASETSKAVAMQALSIGQNTMAFLLNLFVMLYVLYFLLRDGDEIYDRVRKAVPLRSEYKRALFEKFSVVVRATIKGNLIVALLQGGLGGVIFWILGLQAPLLWGALMAILSLLPAVGAAMIWLPVAIYLLATGAVTKGIILLVFGVVVISLVDNVARPILVGKDTKMPDYIVLVSTLGGIAVFGVNGFVLGPIIAAIFIAVWDIFTKIRAVERQPVVAAR
jgi:predicted PurR-regulated permease PerM